MNNSKPKKQVNDYVLLFSAGAALSVIFLWLSASSIFISGYLFSLRAKNWSRGSEEKRKVKISDRIFSFFDGILMRTTLRFKAAGLMHSMIYLGFLGLL